MYILHILIFIWSENVKKYEDMAEYINWYGKPVSLGAYGLITMAWSSFMFKSPKFQIDDLFLKTGILSSFYVPDELNIKSV